MYDSAAAAPADATVSPLHPLLKEARGAVAALTLQSTDRRSQTLKAMGKAILTERDRILEANTLDLEISREMAIPEQVTDWLKLTPDRINRAAHVLDRLGELGSPFVLWGERRRPTGVVAMVYESFPELAAITAGLCLRTGNALVLKGSNEASQTNQTLVDVLLEALVASELPPPVLQLVPSLWSDVTRARLVQQPELDLVIPHGRPKLVEQVVAQAACPVIATYIGGCTLCVRPSASLDTVVKVLVESHQGSPDAVHQINSVILAGEFTSQWLGSLWQALADQLTLTGTASLVRLLADSQLSDVERLETSDSHSANRNRTVAIHLAATLTAAIGWMNVHGQQRAMGLCTALQADVQTFIDQANGIELHINRSPRFYRNPANAVDIALGMSSQQGRIGLRALTKPQPILY